MALESIETWQKKQQSDSLFSLREGENPLIKFFQVGKGNRINGDRQSGILIYFRMLGAHMGFEWAKEFADHIEDYQTTCSLPHGSREMALSAIQFTEWATHDKNKSNVTLTQNGGGKK